MGRSLSLLELLKRRGKFQPEEVARLQLAAPFDLIEAKAAWLAALAAAEAFANERPPEETGCLYYSHRDERFVVPRGGIGLTEPGILRCARRRLAARCRSGPGDFLIRDGRSLKLSVQGRPSCAKAVNHARIPTSAARVAAPRSI